MKITDFADWVDLRKYNRRYPAVLGGRTTSCNNSPCTLLVHSWTPVQWVRPSLRVFLLATISQRALSEWLQNVSIRQGGRLTIISEG